MESTAAQIPGLRPIFLAQQGQPRELVNAQDDTGLAIRLHGHHAVGFHQESDDVVHSAYFPYCNLAGQAKVLKARAAGNQADALAVEYLQAQQRR